MNQIAADLDGFCSGCGGCVSICPTGALSLVQNNEGFYEAALDRKKCIHCGQCASVCPKKTLADFKSLKFKDVPLYAAWSTNAQTRYHSASGGIASEITRWAFNQGYHVAGVVYDDKKQEACLKVASSPKEAEAFKTSKYLQSLTIDAFKTILHGPERPIVVFGLPCQISALHSASLKKGIRDELVLVDFLCHGVPSYYLWKAFLSYLKNVLHNFPDKINFRDKKYGWNIFCFTASSHGKQYIKKGTQCPFYALFFSDLLLNRSCYVCPTRTQFGFSDIRLADFWGDYEANQAGVSAAFPITAKGKIIWEALQKGNYLVAKQGNRDKCRRAQIALNGREIKIKEGQRELILDTLKTMDILKAMHFYMEGLTAKERLFLKIKEILPYPVLRIIRMVKRLLKNN